MAWNDEDEFDNEEEEEEEGEEEEEEEEEVVAVVEDILTGTSATEMPEKATVMRREVAMSGGV